MLAHPSGGLTDKGGQWTKHASQSTTQPVPARQALLVDSVGLCLLSGSCVLMIARFLLGPENNGWLPGPSSNVDARRHSDLLINWPSWSSLWYTSTYISMYEFVCPAPPSLSNTDSGHEANGSESRRPRQPCLPDRSKHTGQARVGPEGQEKPGETQHLTENGPQAHVTMVDVHPGGGVPVGYLALHRKRPRATRGLCVF